MSFPYTFPTGHLIECECGPCAHALYEEISGEDDTPETIDPELWDLAFPVSLADHEAAFEDMLFERIRERGI